MCPALYRDLEVSMLPPGQGNAVWSAFLLLIWLQDFLQDKNFTQTGEESSWAQFVADTSCFLENLSGPPTFCI